MELSAIPMVRVLSGHGVMVAGLIAVAVASEEVTVHPHGDMATLLRVLLLGDPMLFLLVQGWSFWVVLGVWPRPRLMGSAVLLLVGFGAAAASLSIALILAGADLTALAMLDQP